MKAFNTPSLLQIVPIFKRPEKPAASPSSGPLDAHQGPLPVAASMQVVGIPSGGAFSPFLLSLSP